MATTGHHPAPASAGVGSAPDTGADAGGRGGASPHDRSAYRRLTALADRHGASYRLIEHPPEGRTEVVSALRGHEPAQSAKCLVVVVRPDKRTRRYVLAVIPGDRRLDLHRVAECAGGRRVGFADRGTAERLAGSVSGSIVPFSFHPDLELIVEEDLLRNDVLYFNAARLDLSMALATDDYLRMARPRTARITEPAVSRQPGHC